ncbi:hypothetical protein CKO_00264 [Citrobacter koseri ATCC BAA-895]|uniref:Uncharacterized protein n=1 Tax=Citrobacter koseri (strain ATCC BAA-895 / CDC 4225-83 / SGSC4696) TaxID=290338 RepID=A8AD64_CITK8|nr:hypothetical protein CKO_00264 [Citrobacter koseri ATCC BAA-895]
MASQRQPPRRLRRTIIYGVTIKSPSVDPVARHCGTYIDSTCGTGT